MLMTKPLSAENPQESKALVSQQYSTAGNEGCTFNGLEDFLLIFYSTGGCMCGFNLAERWQYFRRIFGNGIS